jgi:adenosylhomocysteine nucleosidase
MEFPGLLEHLTEVRRAAIRVDWARLGRLDADDVLLAANGAGWRRAAQAVDAVLPHFRPDAVVSTGFSGALEESMHIGDVVVADRVVSAAGTYPAGTPVTAKTAHRGTVCSVDRVAETREDKARLRALHGACAVEMEAAGVAERTRSLSVPFFCIRAITDLSGETLANRLNAALRPDGHFDTMIILRGAFCRPFARLPELVRLRRRATQAARTLGDFIAGCRF